jgi:glycosyltransferase involved in cell wall biosynthesis
MIVYYMETYTDALGGDARYLSIVVRHMAGQGREIACLCNTEKLKDYLIEHSNVAPSVFKQVNVKHTICYDQGRRGHSFSDRLRAKVRSLWYPWYFRMRKYACLCVNIPKIYAELKGRAPSMLHINNGGYPGSEGNRAAVIAARLAKIPVVIITVHNLAQSRRRSGFSLIEKLMDSLVYRLVDAIVVDSDASVESLARERGFPREKIVRIYCGVEHAGESSDDDVIAAKKREFGIGAHDPVVSVVANFEERKGHTCFIDAVSSLKRRFTGVKYLLVGDGEMKAAAEEQTRRLGLSRDIIFAGYRNDLHDLLSLIDVLVLPSVGFESFPLIVLHAMAAGIPVVGTSVAGMPEQIVHGETGLVVPPKDVSALGEAIGRLLSDPRTARRMGEMGARRFNEFFTMERMIEEITTLYGLVGEEEGQPAAVLRSLHSRSGKAFLQPVAVAASERRGPVPGRRQNAALSCRKSA